jgi:hypothetical protein
VSGDYAAVVAAHRKRTDVTIARMFGADCLKVKGKVFAIDFKGALVVKLPAARVSELIARGHASAFDPGYGRRMKEWAAIPPGATVNWLAIAEEARTFVSRSAP